jgi:hypothetical protein
MLGLIAGLAGLLLLSFLLVRFPGLRLALIVVGFATSAIFWWIVDRNQARRLEAHSLIPIEAVELRNIRIDRAEDGYRLSGLAHNGSKSYVLDELIIKLTLADCPDTAAEDEACELVGSTTARLHNPWRLSPDETGAIEAIFVLDGIDAVRGAPRWGHAVAQTRARLEP